jgi:hypothetical protein
MYRSRIVFTIVALAVASAAAATIRWQTWTPTTACLLCGAPQSTAAAGTSGSGDALFGAGGGAPSFARNSAGAFTPGPLAAAELSNANAAHSSSSSSTAALRGWQPWGNSSGSNRFASSGASGASAPLGGLWRLMSLNRPAPHESAAAAPRTIVARVKQPRPSRPGKNPAPGTHSGSPASGSTAGPTTTSDTPPLVSVGGAPATDPFHEHEAPPPDPFRGPGGFDPGAPGGNRPVTGGGGGGGGKVSAAPEPGSILLFGTGLLGILGVMRQRRLI